MGRILTVFICTWLSLSPLFGQRLITRQPIQGFHGSGEILAYSSSRIFLQLNKDGEWPRQIQWVILEEGEPLCAITFNKVGWQYTSSADSCALDWMRLDPSAYRYRLFVVESVPSPSESLPDRVAESLLLTRTPRNPLPVFFDGKPQLEITDSTKAQSTLKSTVGSSNIVLEPEDSTYAVTVEVPLMPNPPKIKDSTESARLAITSAFDSTGPTADLAENPAQKNRTPMSDSISKKSPPSAGEIPSTDTIALTREKSIERVPNPSQIDTLHPLNEVSPTHLADSTTRQPSTNGVLNTAEQTPEYIFTVPEYQPRRRWFGRKKKPSTPSTTNSPVPITPEVSEPEYDIQTAPETELPKEDKIPIPSETLVSSSKIENDTNVYMQKAPFISVASFETLEYTQQVLQQFTCPGGCLIVLSSKGQYYRIGFYPDPKNIAVDLREIRKKYPDAWLVK